MEQKHKKSLKINAILNIIQTVASMVFPLLTFPYSSRILGVENIGKYNFGNSIVSYFVLLAGLGISTYGIREGVKYRDCREKFELFVRDVFSINLYSMLFSYFLLSICLLFVPQLAKYRVVIFVLSSQILFVTLGRSWICVVYEDYVFVTVRTIIFYFILLGLLFVVVRSEGDLNNYCIINVLGVVSINILNILYNRKYCNYTLNIRPNLRHLKPILLFFSVAVSTVIYTNSDIVILGFISSDWNVGLYSVSVKVYNIIKQLLAAILTVAIPRFSYYIGKKDIKKFNDLIFNISNTLVIIIFPVVIGLICEAEDIIYILSGEGYINASESLQILSVAIIFNLFAYMFGYCILIPFNREGKFLKATVISAVCNVILNMILIPRFYQNAAAATTLIAEIIASIVCYYYSHDVISKFLQRKNILITLVGCIYILGVCIYIHKYVLVSRFLQFVISVFLSGLGYFLIQCGFHNTFFMIGFENILHRIKKHESITK